MAKKASLNLSLLATIVAASAAGASPGYTYVSDADAKPMLEKGLIEQNPAPDALNANGERQTRATDAGVKFSAANPAPAAGAASEPSHKAAAVFSLGTVDVPEIKRGGGEKPSVWPFDKLGLKGNSDNAPNSFFVPSTPDREDPVKALASTVSGATRKYSVQDTAQPTKTIKAKDGSTKTVPNMKPTRKFVIRAVKDGAPWGDQYAGKPGAAIFRTA